MVYPYIGYPAILSCLSKINVARGPADAGDGSRFSLLFCAYNEAASLPAKLANLRELKSRYPGLEVLAFDDGSTDGSADLIKREAPFVILVTGGGRNGKAHGMKLLAKRAKGEFLIFTDANVQLDTEAPAALAACYADTTIGGVCGALHYCCSEGTATAKVGSWYWRLEERIKDLESATGSVMGADGSIFSIRAELYPEFPDTVLDDFTTSMHVVFSGMRLIKSNDVIAYEQLVTSRSDEYARKVRIAARAFHTHMFSTPKRKHLTIANKLKYFSHKTLRWFGGGFLIIGATTGLAAIAIHSPWTALIISASLATIFLIGVRTTAGLLSSLVEINIAMFATLIGVIKAARGHTFSIWNPAKSRT